MDQLGFDCSDYSSFDVSEVKIEIKENKYLCGAIILVAGSSSCGSNLAS